MPMQSTKSSNSALVRIPTTEELLARFQQNAADMAETARLLVLALDTRPEIMDELEGAGIPREHLFRLERFGRGQLHPKLLFPVGLAERQLAQLTLSEQARALDRGVEVLDADDGSEPRLIPVAELSRQQIRTVFCRGRIRTLAEQRTWLRAENAKRRTVAPLDAPVVKHDYVITPRGEKITRATLLQWLSMMN